MTSVTPGIFGSYALAVFQSQERECGLASLYLGGGDITLVAVESV
jgi:hypothetical protein